MFSVLSVCSQSASWLLVHCSSFATAGSVRILLEWFLFWNNKISPQDLLENVFFKVYEKYIFAIVIVKQNIKCLSSRLPKENDVYNTAKSDIMLVWFIEVQPRNDLRFCWKTWLGFPSWRPCHPLLKGFRCLCKSNLSWS